MKRRSFLAIPFVLPLAGCQYVPAIQSGLQVATDAALALESTIGAIETFVGDYFTAHPNAAEQAKIDAGIIRTKQAVALLADALRTAKDVMALDVQKVMKDAQQAYADLLKLTQPVGVATPGKASAVPSGAPVLVVPEPTAFVVTR